MPMPAPIAPEPIRIATARRFMAITSSIRCLPRRCSSASQYRRSEGALSTADCQRTDLTNVMFLAAAAAGRISVRTAERRMISQRLTVRKPVPWGFLVWTLPLAYVFWAPYQQGAGWFEWTATTLTLLVVLALFLAALTYDED